MADNSLKQRVRKDPAPTDLAAKLVQLQRRTAADTRPRPKADRPAQPTFSKPPEVSREKPLPVIREKPPPRDDFARNMPVASTSTRLFNPSVDPIPIRRTQEPEVMSDIGSSSSPKAHTSRLQQRPDPSASRRLFDPKRDPPVPVRFAVLNRPNGSSTEVAKPTPSHRSSGDYVSASSTSMSSYPPSLGSSAFTLTSASSSGSAPPNKGKEDPNSPVVGQLKRLYRDISHAERKLLEEKQEDFTSEPTRVVVQARDGIIPESPDMWNRLINEHKELAELMHNFMTLTLSPQVPVSFHGYPTSYNIPSRLWTNAFHRILETLRRASLSSPLALEHLSGLIYYAYAFYAGLLENPVLDPYRGGWLEALGDLARYRMAVAAHVASAPFGRDTQLPQTLLLASHAAPEARIDDSPSPSVGPAAALALDVEPERETWRRTARDWYAQGLKETPGLGRLHHHLAIVSREGEGEELRAVYHFVKSMVTSTPFPTSRESILAMFTPAAQGRRMQPDAPTGGLFLLLHGMLFTHIQLDDFASSHARFLERLALEGAEEREWIMMAIINLGAVLEYGRTEGAVRNATPTAAAGGRGHSATEKRVTAVVSRTEELRIGDSTEEEKKMDVDDEPEEKRLKEGDSVPQSHDPPELSLTFQLALQLTFMTLSHALRHPLRKTNAFARPSLNPYITVILTFLSTLTKQPSILAILERGIPWDDLATFFNTIPRAIVSSELELGAKLTQGCSALPEDWCLRGTEWMRRVYERGFWKSETGAGEVDVLDAREESAEGATDGIIEEDEAEQAHTSRQDETGRRWIRVFRASAQLVRSVDGFGWDKTEQRWQVAGTLKEKVERWKELERRDRAKEEERRMRDGRWADDMDVDEAEGVEVEVEEDDSDDDEDSEQVKELKARRRHFRSLLQAAQRGSSLSTSRRRASVHRKPVTMRAPLVVVAGYSILVVDTNILINSLDIFSSLVESLKWTIVVPLAVVTELDGLSSNDSQLGTAASSALSYLSAHLRTHATSLKVQTSRGNYLSTLAVRSEQVDLNNELSWERNMDDLILRAAIWQDEHWVNRSALLKPTSTDTEVEPVGAAKVILLSFDRNLRLKARARQLDAADEKDMAAILVAGT